MKLANYHLPVFAICSTFLVVLLGACANFGKPRESDIKSVLDAFHHDLRWKYNDAAAARVDQRHASVFLEGLENEKDNIHITGWDIRRVELLPRERQAKVRVHFSYYRMPSTVVLEETVIQVWREKDGKWLLLSQEGGPFCFPPGGSSKETGAKGLTGSQTDENLDGVEDGSSP